MVLRDGNPGGPPWIYIRNVENIYYFCRNTRHDGSQYPALLCKRLLRSPWHPRRQEWVSECAASHDSPRCSVHQHTHKRPWIYCATPVKSQFPVHHRLSSKISTNGGKRNMPFQSRGQRRHFKEPGITLTATPTTSDPAVYINQPRAHSISQEAPSPLSLPHDQIATILIPTRRLVTCCADATPHLTSPCAPDHSIARNSTWPPPHRNVTVSFPDVI